MKGPERPSPGPLPEGTDVGQRERSHIGLACSIPRGLAVPAPGAKNLSVGQRRRKEASLDFMPAQHPHPTHDTATKVHFGAHTADRRARLSPPRPAHASVLPADAWGTAAAAAAAAAASISAPQRSGMSWIRREEGGCALTTSPHLSDDCSSPSPLREPSAWQESRPFNCRRARARARPPAALASQCVRRLLSHGAWGAGL